jgi:hypothetical protein
LGRLGDRRRRRVDSRQWDLGRDHALGHKAAAGGRHRDALEEDEIVRPAVPSRLAEVRLLVGHAREREAPSLTRGHAGDDELAVRVECRSVALVGAGREVDEQLAVAGEGRIE